MSPMKFLQCFKNLDSLISNEKFCHDSIKLRMALYTHFPDHNEELFYCSIVRLDYAINIHACMHIILGGLSVTYLPGKWQLMKSYYFEINCVEYSCKKSI